MYSLDDPIETQGQADEAVAMILAMSRLAGSMIQAKRAAKALASLCGPSEGELLTAMEATDVVVAELTTKIASLDDALSVYQDKVEGVHNA